MKSAPKIFLLRKLKGADAKTLEINICDLVSARCLAGSDLRVVLSCPFHQISLFLIVSPIYHLPHEHLPSQITQDKYLTRSFNGNKDFMFLVDHKTINFDFPSVKLSILSTKRLTSLSLLGK